VTGSKAVWWWLGLGICFMGCHLGRPPASLARYNVGQVVGPVAEPGLRDFIRDGIASALGASAILGGKSATAVDVAVLSAETSAVASGPAGQVFAARLELSVLSGSRTAKFSLERAYTVIDAVQASQARAIAFKQLSVDLTQEIVLWLANSPGASGE
jgi:hypothetical protein